jgi:hypothetical protein
MLGLAYRKQALEMDIQRPEKQRPRTCARRTVLVEGRKVVVSGIVCARRACLQFAVPQAHVLLWPPVAFSLS